MGYPLPPTRSGWGTPPGPGMGYPPPDLGWGTPPDLGWCTPPDLACGTPLTWDIASTCYAAGGMPLAFTQEDFLVSDIFLFVLPLARGEGAPSHQKGVGGGGESLSCRKEGLSFLTGLSVNRRGGLLPVLVHHGIGTRFPSVNLRTDKNENITFPHSTWLAKNSFWLVCRFICVVSFTPIWTHTLRYLRMTLLSQTSS